MRHLSLRLYKPNKPDSSAWMKASCCSPLAPQGKHTDPQHCAPKAALLFRSHNIMAKNENNQWFIELNSHASVPILIPSFQRWLFLKNEQQNKGNPHCREYRSEAPPQLGAHAGTTEHNTPLSSQQHKLLKNYWQEIGSNVSAREQRGISPSPAINVSLPACVCATQVLVRCIIYVINVLHWPQRSGDPKCLCKYSSLFSKSCVCTADIHREF